MNFTHLYSIVMEQSSLMLEDYYISLDNYLSSFDMALGENNWNKTGVIDKNQKGIYLKNAQIGKIERIIEDGILYLDHISAKEKGHNIVKKIYPHDKQYADKHGLDVISDLVNDYTYSMFLKTFKDWNISKTDRGAEEKLLKASKN